MAEKILKNKNKHPIKKIKKDKADAQYAKLAKHLNGNFTKGEMNMAYKHELFLHFFSQE